jgi:RimJ/RimL family protein N-acetyltransferase
MIETTDRRVIGELELVQINWRVGSAEIQVCIGEKDCWGIGYGTDALQTLITWSFETFGLGTIYLRVFTSNTRAVRLYERMGFRKEGILTASARRQDPSAVLLMSMTQERWDWITARGGATAMRVG